VIKAGLYDPQRGALIQPSSPKARPRVRIPKLGDRDRHGSRGDATAWCAGCRRAVASAARQTRESRANSPSRRAALIFWCCVAREAELHALAVTARASSRLASTAACASRERDSDADSSTSEDVGEKLEYMPALSAVLPLEAR